MKLFYFVGDKAKLNLFDLVGGSANWALNFNWYSTDPKFVIVSSRASTPLLLMNSLTSHL